MKKRLRHTGALRTRRVGALVDHSRLNIESIPEAIGCHKLLENPIICGPPRIVWPDLGAVTMDRGCEIRRRKSSRSILLVATTRSHAVLPLTYGGRIWWEEVRHPMDCSFGLSEHVALGCVDRGKQMQENEID